MKTAWVVEQGEYSDYRVVGIYSTKENAQRVCDMLNREYGPDAYESATIAEWPMDPTIEELNQGMQMWRVEMRRDGDTERVTCQGFPSYDLIGEIDIWKRSTAPFYAGQGKCDLMVGTVWATDETHAIKIVNEKRAEWIAMNKW